MPPSDPPALWTSWRDVRDDTVVTVVRVRHWNHRFGALPERGQGTVFAEVELASGRREVQTIRQWDFEDNFELIYDPYTGWECAA